MGRPSVRPSVCLSSVCRQSVTFMCRTHSVELFSNRLAYEFGQFVLNFNWKRVQDRATLTVRQTEKSRVWYIWFYFKWSGKTPKARDTLSRNRYQKPVPENPYRFPAGVSCNSIRIFFWYRNLVRVRAVLYSVEETDTGFLVPVFG